MEKIPKDVIVIIGWYIHLYKYDKVLIELEESLIKLRLNCDYLYYDMSTTNIKILRCDICRIWGLYYVDDNICYACTLTMRPPK